MSAGRERGPSNPFRSFFILPDGVSLQQGRVKDRQQAEQALRLQEERVRKEEEEEEEAEEAERGDAGGARAHEGERERRHWPSVTQQATKDHSRSNDNGGTEPSGDRSVRLSSGKIKEYQVTNLACMGLTA